MCGELYIARHYKLCHHCTAVSFDGLLRIAITIIIIIIITVLCYIERRELYRHYKLCHHCTAVSFDGLLCSEYYNNNSLTVLCIECRELDSINSTRVYIVVCTSIHAEITVWHIRPSSV